MEVYHLVIHALEKGAYKKFCLIQRFRYLFYQNYYLEPIVGLKSLNQAISSVLVIDSNETY